MSKPRKWVVIQRTQVNPTEGARAQSTVKDKVTEAIAMVYQLFVVYVDIDSRLRKVSDE